MIWKQVEYWGLGLSFRLESTSAIISSNTIIPYEECSSLDYHQLFVNNQGMFLECLNFQFLLFSFLY